MTTEPYDDSDIVITDPTMTRPYPVAFVAYWSPCERWVYICPSGKASPNPVPLLAEYDDVGCYVTYKGKRLHVVL